MGRVFIRVSSVGRTGARAGLAQQLPAAGIIRVLVAGASEDRLRARLSLSHSLSLSLSLLRVLAGEDRLRARRRGGAHHTAAATTVRTHTHIERMHARARTHAPR